MAYESPVTMVTGTVVTAGIWNQDIVNNTIFLHSPPGALVRQSSDVVITTNVETILDYDTEVYDVDGCFDAGGQTDRLTAPLAGIYVLMMTFQMQIPDNYVRGAILASDGDKLFHDVQVLDTPYSSGFNSSGMAKLQSGQYVRVAAYHETGSDATVRGEDPATKRGNAFGIQWIGSGEAT